MTFTLNCKGRLLVLDRPIVMGILNATPDSFYNRGRESSETALFEKAAYMLQDGAAILDIGGMSTRPNAEEIGAEEELNRVIPLITSIRSHFPEAFLSIDTYRAVVAKQAIEAGADIVNDISAGDIDPAMIHEVARLNVPYITMHMQGTPGTMQQNPTYNDVTQDILDYFIRKIQQCEDAGIKDLIIDPGFGFGKRQEDNYHLLKHLHVFHLLKKPLLIGISRKSMIYKLLGHTAEEALNGSTVLHTLALQQGCQILRVHDVREARECISLWEYYQSV
jgi:dihydropteroate synthase